MTENDERPVSLWGVSSLEDVKIEAVGGARDVFLRDTLW
jgi:hypothetical protein